VVGLRRNRGRPSKGGMRTRRHLLVATAALPLPLVAHAKKGGEGAVAVVPFLESLQAA
jgi:hypothetical protein